MAISISGLTAYSITGNNSTTVSRSITVTGAPVLKYWRAYLFVKGNATAAASTPLGYDADGSLSFSFAPTQSTLVSRLEAATGFAWYVRLAQYANATAYTDDSPVEATYDSAETTLDFATSLRAHPAVSLNSGNTFNLDTTTSLPISFTEPFTSSNWRSRLYFYVIDYTTKSTLIDSDSGVYGPYTKDMTSFVSAMVAAMSSNSPATLRMVIQLGWSLTGGTASVYWTAQQTTVDISMTRTFTTYPNPTITGQYAYFQNTGWTNSYFYTVANASINADGTYNIVADIYLYNEKTINSTLTSSSTVSGTKWTSGGNQAFSTAMSKETSGYGWNFATPVTGAAQTRLLGRFKANAIGPFPTKEPQVTIATTIVLSEAGTKVDTVLTPISILPTISLLDENDITTSTLTNGALAPSTIADQTTVIGITGNDYSFYKPRISESTNGSTFSNSKDGAFGDITKTVVWGTDSGTTDRAAYTIYYYKYDIIGRDNSTTAGVIKSARANDAIPTINAFSMVSKTSSSISVTVSVGIAVSPIVYSYYYKKSIDPSYTLATSIGSASYTYSSLDSNTAYDFKVTVTNIDGSTATSGEVGQAANLTSISTFANAPTFDSPAYSMTKTDTTVEFTVNAIPDSGLTLTYSFGRKISGVWNWTAYGASDTYTWVGLSSGLSYDFDFRIKDSLDNIVQYSSVASILTITTYAAAPVINSVNFLNITSKSATIKVSTANNPATTITKIEYKVYKDGDPEPGTWTEKSSTYLLSSLLANQLYNVKVQVTDNQGLTSAVTTTSFTTAAFSITNTQAKFIRTTSTDLDLVPIRDGNMIVTTNNGNIYLDTNNTTRVLISVGMKIYSAVKGADDIYTITTDDFDYLDKTSGRTLSFYMQPDQTSTGSVCRLTIDGTITDYTELYLYTTAGTQIALTGNALYLVIYNNGVSPAFILVNY